MQRNYLNVFLPYLHQLARLSNDGAPSTQRYVIYFVLKKSIQDKEFIFWGHLVIGILLRVNCSNGIQVVGVG